MGVGACGGGSRYSLYGCEGWGVLRRSLLASTGSCALAEQRRRVCGVTA